MWDPATWYCLSTLWVNWQLSKKYPLTSITWPYRGLTCRPIEVWCSFCLPLTCFRFLTLTDRRLNCNWISLLQSSFISGIKLRLQPRLFPASRGLSRRERPLLAGNPDLSYLMIWRYKKGHTRTSVVEDLDFFHVSRSRLWNDEHFFVLVFDDVN